MKQKRVIGNNGELEVRNIEVPILVCPDRHKIARPENNSTLGENNKNVRTNIQNDKKDSTLPSAQSIEGKVSEGLKPQMEVANTT